jgi:spore coat polysaccharide biosynthesis protein SpsF
MKKITAIIEARLDSKRLPNKVLKKIKNKEIIQIILERLKKSKMLDQVVVATTNNKKDNRLVKFLDKKKIKFFRGSENDIFDRILKTADKFETDIIVRVTADNPFTDPLIIDYMIKYFKKLKKIDFLTNNSFGDEGKRNLAYGLDISIFSFNSLKHLSFQKKNKILKEFPTLNYFTEYSKKNLIVKNINLPKKMIIDKKYRLTVDTKEDLKFMRKIFKYTKSTRIKINKLRKILTKNFSSFRDNSNIKQFIPK